MNQITISRKAYCLDSKLCPDCKFLVGGDCADAVFAEICGHKAIFASVSSVFKNMFFGSIPEEGHIIIPDIRPEIFHEMVGFFYTGTITISSVEQALEVWYAADKYNLEDLLNCIPDYIISNMTPQNACCILQFPILHSNEIVKRKCQEIIKTEISSVLNGTSFLEADFSTLSFIFDQEDLNVPEIELFRALVRYDNARKNKIDDVKSVQPRSGDLEVKEDENVIDSGGEGSSKQEDTATPGGLKEDNLVKQLVKKIRFLQMTPKEFAECVGMSSLLSTSEALSIFVNICDPTNRTHPMPEGYCNIEKKRERKYCNHAIAESHYYDHVSGEPLKFELDFKSSMDIKMTGVQVNNRLVFTTYYGKSLVVDFKIKITSETDVIDFHEEFCLLESDSFQDVIFDHPVRIRSGTLYTITFTSESIDLDDYLGCVCSSSACTDDVTFEFGRKSYDCNCKGFIRSIIFNTYE